MGVNFDPFVFGCHLCFAFDRSQEICYIFSSSWPSSVKKPFLMSIPYSDFLPNAPQKKDGNSIKPIKKGIVVAAFSTNTLFDRFNNQKKLPISYCNSFCKRKCFKSLSRLNSKTYFRKYPLLFS